MATEVTLPALGESVTEGTVTRWLKQVGDTVAVDEPLLEVSTDKVDTEIPSPVAGTVLEIRANEDDTVEVGAVLALVGDESEAPAGGSAPAEDEGGAEAEAAEAPPEEQPADDGGAQQQSAPSGGGGAGGGGGGGGGGGTEVTLPALGESVTEGTVTRWLKQVGDEVAVDEPLLEVSTDKVDTEIPSPVAGTLLEIAVSEDETVEVGAKLAVIGDASAAPAPSKPEPEPEPEPKPEAAPEAKQEPAPAPSPQAPSSPAPSEAASEEAPSYVTPLVRKMAAQHGVDLASVKGTGVGGRIRKQDVLDAAKAAEEKAAAPAPAAPAAESAPPAPAKAPPAAAPSPLRGKTEKMSRLRKVIATRMVESLQVSAQLTSVVEVDMTNVAKLRASVQSRFTAAEGVKLSFMPFFAKAATDALKVHPVLNASMDMEKGEVTYFDKENLAIAVDTERGLLTPVIKEAEDLSIAGLAKKIVDVAERTRTNKIGPDELSGGTFTLTNTGSRGALFDTPILNQPQVAILGTGAIVKRVVVMNDPNLGETLAIRQMVYLALTYDHRLVDGADAARFLVDVKKRLESGAFDV